MRLSRSPVVTRGDKSGVFIEFRLVAVLLFVIILDAYSIKSLLRSTKTIYLYRVTILKTVFSCSTYDEIGLSNPCTLCELHRADGKEETSFDADWQSMHSMRIASLYRFRKGRVITWQSMHSMRIAWQYRTNMTWSFCTIILL